MSDTSANNKRIAKNTIFLYFRMAFLMIISLYTSRVVLNALGVEDFGTYNVVGGIVTMMSFLNGAMSSATQRFISFALGKGNSDILCKTFNTSLFLHFAIAIIIIVFAETIGLWFLNEKLVVPDDRLYAAKIVFQFSIISSFFQIMNVPFNSTIVAHEKMNAFAYISIFDGLAKLSIAYIISISDMDRLIFYGALLCLVSIIHVLLYIIYCRKSFDEVRFESKIDKTLFKEITGYVSWSMYANLSGVVYSQGLNMLLNVFFGPTVNAARGIAYSVQHAVTSFSINFQLAVNPQITKYYAQKNMREMYKLMIRSARFSFYLLFSICLPIWLMADVALKLWLKTVPDDAVIFCRFVLIIALIDTISNPLTKATQATGNLKRNSILGGTNLLMILPISYLALYMGFPPYSVFIVNMIFAIVGMFIRLYINKYLINFPVGDFLKNVFLKNWGLAVLIGILPFYINVTYIERNLVGLIELTLLSILLSVIVFYCFGLEENEKKLIKDKCMLIFKK